MEQYREIKNCKAYAKNPATGRWNLLRHSELSYKEALRLAERAWRFNGYQTQIRQGNVVLVDYKI